MKYIIISSTGIKLSQYHYIDLVAAIKEAQKMDKHYSKAGITFRVEVVDV